MQRLGTVRAGRRIQHSTCGTLNIAGAASSHTEYSRRLLFVPTRSAQMLHSLAVGARRPLCAPLGRQLVLRPATCGYATNENTPRLSRAERRRRERAKKKGKVVLPMTPATTGTASEKDTYAGGQVELNGVTDLGIFKAIKHNFSYVRHAHLLRWSRCLHTRGFAPRSRVVHRWSVH
jgi:hypothetical protein